MINVADVTLPGAARVQGEQRGNDITVLIDQRKFPPARWREELLAVASVLAALAQSPLPFS